MTRSEAISVEPIQVMNAQMTFCVYCPLKNCPESLLIHLISIHVETQRTDLFVKPFIPDSCNSKVLCVCVSRLPYSRTAKGCSL